MEINTKDFRIGNYYNQFGNTEKVSWSTLKTLEESTTEQLWFKPIPLTEEVLLKCGFEKKKWDNIFSIYSEAKNCFIEIEYDIYANVCVIKDVEFNIKHLHALQNLIHALTGEELTYNHS